MLLNYILLLLGSVAFFLLYNGFISFMLLVFMVAAPILLFALLVVCSAFTDVKVCYADAVTEKGGEAVIKVNLNNRSFLPVTDCRVKVEYAVSAPLVNEFPSVYTASLSVSGRTSKTVTLKIKPEHVGKIRVQIKYVRIYDLMTFTFVRKKVNFRTEITVLPRVFPISAETRDVSVYSAESNSFSKEKAGDDPSEIFMLREYRDGDRHNLIHWKLSGRSEELIVRELSKPVSSKLLILADFGGAGGSGGADRVIEAAAAASSFFAENGTPHFLAVPLSDYTLGISEITGEDSFYAAFTEISRGIGEIEYASGIEYVAELYDSAFIINGGFSKVIAVSERCGAEYVSSLSSLCGEARLTVICTSPDPQTDAGENKSDSVILSADVIFADAEKLGSGEEYLSF